MKLYWPRIKYKNDKGAIEEQWTYDSALNIKECNKTFKVWQGIYLIKEAWIDVTDTEDPAFKERIDVKFMAQSAETSQDCISRAAAIREIDKEKPNLGSHREIADDMIENIKALHSVEPERKTGKWIRAIDPDVNAWTGGHTCSECGRACVQMSMNYCANCGAPMEVEHER